MKLDDNVNRLISDLVNQLYSENYKLINSPECPEEHYDLFMNKLNNKIRETISNVGIEKP